MAAPAFRAAPVRIRVPATSANLGPGFDALGLALTLYDDVVVRIAETGLTVDIAGEGAEDLRRDRRNLVVRALRAAFDLLGGQRGESRSSARTGSRRAAAWVPRRPRSPSGITAARALVGLDSLTRRCCRTENWRPRSKVTPDNVAACLRGGLTLAWRDSNGPRSTPLDVIDDLVPVAFVPTTQASTTRARRMLPETVPHADAAASAGRAALLVEALGRRPDLLLLKTEDRLGTSPTAHRQCPGARSSSTNCAAPVSPQ